MVSARISHAAISVAAFFFAALVPSISLADCRPDDVIADRYLVRLKSPHVAAKGLFSIQAMQAKTQATLAISKLKSELTSKHIRFENIFAPGFQDFQTLSTSETRDLPPETILVHSKNKRNMASLAKHPAVLSVESDCRVHLFGVEEGLHAQAVPNDPNFNSQWGLQKINAPAAWDISTGSTDIIVGVSDTGVDYQHPDLQANIWTNSKEIPGNGKDDDQNGCVDDYYGCDVTTNNGDGMPPNDEHFIHGTHVAGIIGAVGNNGQGVSGVNQHVHIMPIKAFETNGGGGASLSSLIRSIYYGVYMGARVINCSWGRQGQPQQSEIDAFKYALTKKVMVVVAAGNSHEDVADFSPASIPYVITVAASDSQDRIASFSNYGKNVKFLAPGGYGYDASNNMIDPIFSTLPRFAGSYGNMIGTSMASPFVAGLAALVLSVNPNLDPYQVYHAMRDGGDQVTVTTAGGTFTYPRINALGALKLAK